MTNRRATRSVGPGAGREARADNELRVVLGHRVEQRRDLCRVVLAVGVTLHDNAVAVRDRPPKPAPQRTADSEVHGKSEHDRAGVTGRIGRAVERAVVDHERGISEVTHRRDDTADRLLLVERGDHDEHVAAALAGQPRRSLVHEAGRALRRENPRRPKRGIHAKPSSVSAPIVRSTQ